MSQAGPRSNTLLWWGLALILLAGLGRLALGAQAPRAGWRPGPRMPWHGTTPSPEQLGSNGERIYFTGINEQGQVLPFRGGPHWFQTHGGGCADCHGSSGTGGIPVMMGTVIPPDIRYSSLTAPVEDDHVHEHPPYTDALIKRAIT